MGEAIQTRAIRYSQSRTAVVSYLVIANGQQEALDSVPVKSGATYEFDGLLYARPPVASRSRDSVGLWEVEVTYESLANGFEIMSTLSPGEFGISWEPGIEQEPFSFDGDGIYVANTAGVVFDPPPTKPRVTHHLSITQFEVPNSAHWDKYIETTNAKAVTLFTGAGTEALKPDEILCANIRPLSQWKMLDNTSTAPLMGVRYEFEIRYGGHYLSTTNKGDSGWFMGPPAGTQFGADYNPILQRGNFYNSAGSQLTDVLLDLDGMPYAKDQGIRCGKWNDMTFPPVAAPDQYHADPSRAVKLFGLNSALTGASASKQQIQIGWSLNFRRYTAVDMTEVLDPAST